MNRRDFLLFVGLSSLAGVAGLRRLPANPDSTNSLPQTAPSPEFAPDVELILTAEPDKVPLLSGRQTLVWRFTGRLLKGPVNTLQVIPGSYLGPVLHFRRGQKVRVHFINQLPEDSVVHWHGLDVPTSADGHPKQAVGSCHEAVVEFEVNNRAGTYWYHPHPDTRTGAQVYQGLAGLLLVRDAEEDALALPGGEAEHLCVIQDRQFDDDNQLVYTSGGMMGMMNGFLGDQVLVNGLAQQTTEVDAAWHRVRFLNGSNARIYKLAWNHDLPMTVIGGDGGLLEEPLRQDVLTLAPGQRADVLLDLSTLAAGSEVHLESQSFPEADAGMGGMGGMMGGGASVPNGAPLRVMSLRLSTRKGPAFRVPEKLSSFDQTWSLKTDAPIRNIPLTFQQMNWLIDGRTFAMDEVALTESVAVGSTHLWEFVNLGNSMGMQAAHPIHIHGRQFRVVSRTGGSAANELRAGTVDAGWRDTVLVLPGETVRVQVTFTRHPGLYLYHCHILEHEDMGMMRNFRVT